MTPHTSIPTIDPLTVDVRLYLQSKHELAQMQGEISSSDVCHRDSCDYFSQAFTDSRVFQGEKSLNFRARFLEVTHHDHLSIFSAIFKLF